MAAGRKYKIVVVEDEPMIITNIIEKIEKAGSDFIVAGCAQDGSEALSVIGGLKPDILLTDIRMPKLNGIELIKQIKSKYPDMQIVIISGYGNFEYAQQAIKLGVKDYLLKPISVEALKNTLSDIKTRLDQAVLEREKGFLLSCATGLSAQYSMPDDLGNCLFGIYILCIGHLLNHIPDQPRLESCLQRWNEINWEDSLPPNARWRIIDEKYPNQKCLIMATDDVSADASLVSSRLFCSLRAIFAPLPVNIGACPSFVHYTDVWPMQQNLRTLLEQRLVIGRSAIFTSAGQEKGSAPPAILETALQNKISALISQGNTAFLRSEIIALLDKWQAAQYTQRWVETVLGQLFRLIQRQLPAVSEEDMLQAEQDVNEMLWMASGLQDVSDDIWRRMEMTLISSDMRNNSIKELIARIAAYIDSNYCADINIEDIARKFNFNPTYLSKVFKKEKGITPVKYITSLRIKEAERLMKENRELDIRQIAEIVGYDDPQYFSRIFKIVTNETPSEYRDTMLKSFLSED
jgi:two-component system, response regulator YesN